MSNFAKLLKTPPKKRMAAALRGFGFTSAPAARPLRGLGYVRTSATVTNILQQQGMTADAAKAVVQERVLLTAPKSVPTTLTVYSPTPAPAPVQRNTNLRREPAPAEPAREQEQPGQEQEQEQPGPEQESESESESEYSYAEGREESFIPPADTEEGEPAWSQDSGGSAESLPADAQPKADAKKIGIKKSAQTGSGLMAQIKALPMPVKVIGGVAIAYVVWKVLE